MVPLIIKGQIFENPRTQSGLDVYFEKFEGAKIWKELNLE